ncbi:MAG: hypothetical protein HEQ32_02935 [Vampirovibrio sp.]
MSQKGLHYASILMGYPIAAFVLLSGVNLLFQLQLPHWAWLVAMLLAHLFSWVYIIKGLDP